MGVNGILRAAGFAPLAAIFTLVHDRMSAWPGHGYLQTGGRPGFGFAISIAMATLVLPTMCQTAAAQRPAPGGSSVLEDVPSAMRFLHNATVPPFSEKHKCRRDKGAEIDIERLEAALAKYGNLAVSPGLDLEPTNPRQPHLTGNDYNQAVQEAEAQLAKWKALPPCNPKPKARHPGKGKGVKNLHMPQRQRIGMGIDVPHVELASWTPGRFVGAQFTGSSSRVTTSEFLAATGMRTNQFDDNGSGFGGGVNFGYNTQPWGNNVVVGAVFDINWLNDSVRHDFPGGNYIGSTVNFTASALARGGILVTPNVLLYGQTGISVANQQLKIDFGGPETNESRWTPGFALGFGGEWMLPVPVLPISKGTSVFVGYKRTWWNTANLTMPAASPFFNYGWQRQTDGIDIGLRFRW